MDRRWLFHIFALSIVIFACATSFIQAVVDDSAANKVGLKQKPKSITKTSSKAATESCDYSYLLIRSIRCMLDSTHLLNVVSSFVNIKNTDSIKNALDMQIVRIEDGLAEGKAPRKVSLQEALGALALPIIMNVDKHADYEMPHMIWKTLSEKADDSCLLLNDLARCAAKVGLPCLAGSKDLIKLGLQFLPKQVMGFNLESLDPSDARIERMISGLSTTLPLLIPQETCLPYTREIALTYACMERVAFKKRQKCFDADYLDDSERENIKNRLHWGYGYFLLSLRTSPPEQQVCDQYEQVGKCLWQEVTQKCVRELEPAVGSQIVYAEMFAPQLADTLLAGVCPLAGKTSKAQVTGKKKVDAEESSASKAPEIEKKKVDEEESKTRTRISEEL